MVIYRVLKRLWIGGDNYLLPGETTKLEWLNPDKIAKLLAVRAVSEVNPPPLAELPGFSRRAQRMYRPEISVLEFLEEDTGELADALGVKARTIERWKQEAMKGLTVEQARDSG